MLCRGYQDLPDSKIRYQAHDRQYRNGEENKASHS
jgi:hypothetical protein